MRPSKQNAKEKQLMEWAKEALSNQDPPIKVTNLSSSWQNGLGFCALIRQQFPRIVPPITQLKRNQMSQNCQIAFEAANLLGIETSNIISVETITDKLILDKHVVKTFLQELKSILQYEAIVEVSEEDIVLFQCRWYRKAGFFADSAADIIQNQEMDQKKAKEEAERAIQGEKERLNKEQFDKEREETRKKLYENGKQFNLDEKDRSKNRQAKDLIKDAHNSIDSENVICQNPSDKIEENLDMPDTDDKISNLKKVFPDDEQGSPDSEPTLSTSTTQENPNCAKDDSSASGYIFKNDALNFFKTRQFRLGLKFFSKVKFPIMSAPGRDPF